MTNINFNVKSIRSFCTSPETFDRGLDYYNSGRVSSLNCDCICDPMLNEDVMLFKSDVNGSADMYDVSVTVDGDGNIMDFGCTCPAFASYTGCCKHIAAVLLNIYYRYGKEESYPAARQTRMYPALRSHQLEELMDMLGDRIISDVLISDKQGHVALIPSLVIISQMSLGLVFTIGQKRKYVVKNVYRLAEDIVSHSFVKYGKGFGFSHELSDFDSFSRLMVSFLTDEYRECSFMDANMRTYFNVNLPEQRLLPVLPAFIDRFFDLFYDRGVSIGSASSNIDRIVFKCGNPDIGFSVEGNSSDYRLVCDTDIDFVAESPSFGYAIIRDSFFRCSLDYFHTVLLTAAKISGQPSKAIPITDSYMGKFLSVVASSLTEYATVTYSKALSEKYAPCILTPRLFLDVNSSGCITAELIFDYDGTYVNPFSKAATDNEIWRDLRREAQTMAAVENTGFVCDGNVYVLCGEQEIFEFVSANAMSLSAFCELNALEGFRSIRVREPKPMTVGIRLKGNLLDISTSPLPFDTSQLEVILSSYRRKKPYYRLKDGSFLKLDSGYFDTLERMSSELGISSDKLKSGSFTLSRFDAVYLDSILGNDGVRADWEQSLKLMAESVGGKKQYAAEPPAALAGVMRSYQTAGFSWLSMQAFYSFGGILADDMGLGKTLQVLSLILSEAESNRPSIVVAPTSLIYNWQSEAEKFAPSLNVLIVSGQSLRRRELIEDIPGHDLVITSYDMVKRDIEFYSGLKFRFCVIDEAQYIKNALTQNARAVKQLSSDVRFALTGTPIENSLSDLWSIFDFIMPKFLYSYNVFRQKYEYPIVKENNKDVLERLNTRIKPFILRRLKKDVLKELPDKTETIIYSEMDEVQSSVYMSQLAQVREQLSKEPLTNGSGRIKILALLMRLRQICCHPSLCFDAYNGYSAKTDLCMELIRSSTGAGHKVLLFSQFTSMLDILAEKLAGEGIGYYMLTGSTPSRQRGEMAARFNSDDVPVFLISLRAGGTGLNLTGADIVIHYDLWWNMSAQNQATDRTHRIGQKNKVQVYKLIVKDTVEEKIERLQQSKRDLAESVITEGEIMLDRLTDEEIESLFDM